MPRLTTNLYLERHRFVAKAWTDFPTVFTVVAADQQWDVHAYYQTASIEPDEKLLEARDELTAKYPSLPHRAGKAFARIYQAFCFAYEHAKGDEALFFQLIRSQAPVPASALTTNGRTISVRPLVKPDPAKQLARVLLRMAEQKQVGELTPDEAADEQDAA